MKKSVTAALAAAVVVGASSTSFAAMNPFSDVPAGHWAYQAVSSLAQEGVIEGYGDATYRGERTITRYEMAQMIAKALARTDANFAAESGINVDNRDGVVHQHVNKEELNRLVEEFRPELEQLGVLEKRVNEMWKYSDKVTWHGKIEYTYNQRKEDPFNTGHKSKSTDNGFIFRFEPKAEVAEHWTVNARIDAEADMKDDTSTEFSLKRAWAEGDYDKFNIKIGKFEFCPAPEAGLIWDTEISGAELIFGSKWKFTATGGRISADQIQGGSNGLKAGDLIDDYNDDIADPATVVGLRVDYDQGEKGLFGGAAWYHIKDDDLAWSRRQFINKIDDGTIDVTDKDSLKHGMKRYNKADVWTVNLGYKFSDLLTLSGGYAHNTKADFEKNSWQAELNYGNYDDASEKGQWSVWSGYRKFGTNATLMGTVDDDAMLGTRGWVVGAAWAPLQNIGVIAKYFNGKYITDVDGSHGKAEKIFGRVEFFF